MSVATKRIRERVTQMNNAWAQAAPTAVFGGITKAAFQASIQAAATADQGIADLEAQLTIKRDQRDSLYANLNNDSIKIRDGVEADPTFGRDHPIVEAMGFVRESTRKSGLTRKKKPPTTPPTQN
jgi:hypothetical protein